MATAICPAHAEMLSEELGDGCPCFAGMLDKARRLARKRRATDSAAAEGTSRVVARRTRVLADATGAYAPKTLRGDAKLKLFKKFLEAIDERYMKRSMGQREFHEAFTVACLPHIIGEAEFEKHRAYYLEKFDLDEFKSEVLVTTPRRFGKTTAVSMFVAALLCCCDRMWISIFSTGKRASKSLLMQVKEIIDTIPGMTKRITSSNVEELWINPIGCSKKVQEARCFSYPSSVKVRLPAVPIYIPPFAFFCIHASKWTSILLGTRCARMAAGRGHQKGRSVFLKQSLARLR